MREYHGLTHSKEWNTFQCIQQRCNNPNHHAYTYYGGRGIACNYTSFEAFLADVGPPPTPHHTIERLDNDKPYEQGNCEWRTRKEQANNRRSSRWLTYLGETHTMAQWSEITGVPYKTLHFRVSVKDWPLEKAFSEPLRKPELYEYQGEQLCAYEIARRAGLSPRLVERRAKEGKRGETLVAPPQNAGNKKPPC